MQVQLMTKFNRFHIQSMLSTRCHKQRGSQIVELPPALLLLFFVLLFPFINMLYLICSFAAGWYLNSMELRQVACHTPSSIGLTNPPDQAYHHVDLSALGLSAINLFGVSEDIISPEVAQFPPIAPGSNPNLVDRSRVRTTINIAPIVKMQNVGSLLPMGEVPGLGKPFTFVYNGEIQQEDQGP
jgi:hypothetical protein